MHRFYVPARQCAEGHLFLTGREAHHAMHVVRVREGERVLVLDGEGTRLDCEVEAHDRDKIRLKVLERNSAPRDPIQITLLQALPKGKLMESIVTKATELGACRIVPILSERVVARMSIAESRQKVEKWRLAAVEAIKQCGALWLPVIEAPVKPHEYIARHEAFDLSLIATLEKNGKSPRHYFGAFHDKHGRMPQSVSVWVGPEGDFSPSEVDAISSGSGALPITLGPLVLRSETASIYCLSVLSYEMRGS